ncbi:hypothetical protein GCM10022198_25490 [Klugiella xanthotipulae]
MGGILAATTILLGTAATPAFAARAHTDVQQTVAITTTTKPHRFTMFAARTTSHVTATTPSALPVVPAERTFTAGRSALNRLSSTTERSSERPTYGPLREKGATRQNIGTRRTPPELVNEFSNDAESLLMWATLGALLAAGGALLLSTWRRSYAG